MRNRYLIIVCSFKLLTSFGQVYTVETVPNVKLINNSYVSNPDTILSESTVYEINQQLAELERVTTVQVAVVVVQSIGSADIFDFAQELFNTWGIGKSAKNNGLLILMVIDQRTIRFHTGYGLEGVLPDIVCKQIETRLMIPSFKIEDYDEGMKMGIGEVIFALSDPAYADELRDDSIREVNGWNLFFKIAGIGGLLTSGIWFLALYFLGSFADSKPKEKNKIQYPEMRMTKIEWVILFGAIPLGLLLIFNSIIIDTGNHILVFLTALYCYFGLTLIYKRIRMRKVVKRFLPLKDYKSIVALFQDYQIFWLVMLFLFPFPVIPVFIEFLSRKKYFRNHPRDCKSCGTALQKLDEKSDDQFLKEAQVFEENIKSVDYDVWLCSNCKNFEALNYVNLFSKYKPCPKCKTRAFYTESRRTTVSPTHDSPGSGQQTDRCKFCHHIVVSSYSIAKLTRPSSSSSSSGGSSGGGSWGGGRSGGGGASSSW